MNLCLSVSIAEGVRDVTWRYNNQHKQLCEDRKKYLVEGWLLEFLKIRFVFTMRHMVWTIPDHLDI